MNIVNIVNQNKLYIKNLISKLFIYINERFERID